ncbi:MAG: phosphoribosylformylglycinamidine synthase subunit PurS [Ktedonobacterales bacterium]
MAETIDVTTGDTTGATATQPTWLARIHVMLKQAVLDPQGEAVLHGLHQLGYNAVSQVRVGKYLEVTLAAANQAEAEAAVRQMCDRLLANPVIERYDYEVSAPPSQA